MLLLENQHRPQPDGLLPTAPNIDAHALGLLQHLVPTRRVPRDERALTLAAQVVDLAGVLPAELLQAVVEVVARLSRVFDEAQTFDFVDDGAEEEGACWVALDKCALAL